MTDHFFFGLKSKEKMDTLDKRAKSFLKWALYRSPMDFSVIEGYRGEELQNLYFRTGASQLKYPESEHNLTDGEGNPASLAFHLLPAPSKLPIQGYDIWEDRERLTYLAGIIVGLGAACAIESGETTGVLGVRWGGDWDSDGILNRWDKHKLDDLTHYELVVKER